MTAPRTGRGSSAEYRARRTSRKRTICGIIAIAVRTVTVAERPDLTEQAEELTRDLFPEYNNHGDVFPQYWGRLTAERPEFQFHVLGDAGEVLARAHSLPVRWDGSIHDLPAGFDQPLRVDSMKRMPTSSARW